MRPPVKDNEEKKLQRNQTQRLRYAEMPEEKKAIMLQRRRAAYAAKKNRESARVTSLPERQICTTSHMGTMGNIHTSFETACQIQCTPQESRREDEQSLSSSFEIGSSSAYPFGSAFLLTTPRLYPPVPSFAGRTTRPRTQRISRTSGDNILNNIAAEANTLPEVPSCKYCAAKRFWKEPKGFCCSDGQVSLVCNDVPLELYDLFTSQTEDAFHFQTYIRTYNNTFAFTSFGVKYDKELSKRNKGIYTFKVQGQVYHFINDLTAAGNPSYIQLYFYDTENELRNRMISTPKLKASVVEKLISILKINPYAKFFRGLTNVPNLSAQEIKIRKDPHLDQRVYNSPSVSQVAAIWFENSEATERKDIDIIVYNHAGYTHQVKHYYGCYDSLQYPLLFVYGESGWHRGIERVEEKKSNTCGGQLLIDPLATKEANELIKAEEKIVASAKKKVRPVSCREYYSYKLQMRPRDKSVLLRAGRLLQQYIVDMYIKIETCRLDYFAQNQNVIRSDVYKGLLDSVAIGERRGCKVGKRIVLPASYTGGPRDMHKRYIDAMTLVQKFGKPDIMLTMTCNPNWLEIKNELQYGEEPQNRPDLVSRVFRAKLELLKDELIKKEVLGPIAAYTYVIEYQKRGLPHVHFLLIFKSKWKLLSPDSYDKIVSAELPDKEKYPQLYAMVVKHMIHGPCGKKNPENVCMLRDGKCKNHYPKQFSSATIQGDDSYPIYRRRNDGKQVKVRGSILDNRWVIPYNPYLLAKFNCHINVEICSSIKAVKYLYKYIYKGHDRVAFQIVEDKEVTLVDEIQQYQSARWVSAAEAMWRIYRFPLNEMHPSVMSLQLHLEGKQLVSFREYDNLENVIRSDRSTATMLTEFFEFYRRNPSATKYLYKEFPEHFVWDNQGRIWTSRQRNESVGRIVTPHPIEGERYYMRLLLNHIEGPDSYDQLLTFDGHKAKTFRESALLHGLLESDNNLEECLQEATSYQMHETLRRLFATVLVYCSPNNPKKIWKTFESPMSEDYQKRKGTESNDEIQLQVLQNINSKLLSMGKKFEDYELLGDNTIKLPEANVVREIEDELSIITPQEDIQSVITLNTQQKKAYDTIMERIYSGKHGAFFIDGPGGTGKTYLYCALLANVRCRGHIALATATSGVAASILPGGRTTHSRFNIPVNVDANTTCNVGKQTGLAEMIRATKLIIWDEASMAKKQLIEAVDKMLQDITDCKLPFGGKVVVFGGDFRQVLPVLPRATREEAINESLIKSFIWPTLEKLKLTENMRAKFDTSFTDMLLRIGNGTEKPIFKDKIAIPSDMIIPYTDPTESMNRLANHVFANLHDYAYNPRHMTGCAILTPKNDYVDEINNLLIDAFPGDIVEYKSFDRTIDTSQQGQHEDFINTLTPKGFPTHRLRLKKHCPIMLIRNIDPPEGLSNGTRLICLDFKANMVYAEIVAGSHRGKKVFLPRIPFQPNDDEKYPVPFERKQIPIRVCFAMTMNKAQGQTLDYVGLYLPEPVFSHGQLYVALSRARTSNSIKIMVKPTEDDTPENNAGHACTTNIVYQELLDAAQR